MCCFIQYIVLYASFCAPYIIVTKDLLEVDKLTGKKTLNEAQIEALTCSVYRIEKQTGYNETDLSTIRTIITPIK